ncbi:MAG: C39 family peptidase, partial [Kiritimatiellae bacterium]|nr:C39 family peptidase [Kiritimatiellia bacterium]
AAAAVARIMGYWGLDFLDQHQIAGWAESDPAAGTSPEALAKGLSRVLHDRYGLAFRALPAGGFDLMDVVREYNKAARKEGMAEVRAVPDPATRAVDGEAVLREFDPALFMRVRSQNAAKLRAWTGLVRKSVDSGIPLVWSVVLGFAPEEPPLPGASGAHVRIITGYDDARGVVVYTDSWGAGHERKEMPYAAAAAITTALHSIAPTPN